MTIFPVMLLLRLVSTLTANAVIPVLDKTLGQYGEPDIIKTYRAPLVNRNMSSDYARYNGFHHRKITPMWPLVNAEEQRL